jgi:hypothetical protein
MNGSENTTTPRTKTSSCVVPALIGAGSKLQTRYLHEATHREGDTTYTDIARYFGCQYHHHLALFLEMANRIKAARIGFASMKGF